MCARERLRERTPGRYVIKGRFSDVEFDGKCRIIQMSNFVIVVGVRMAVAIEMNWRLSKSRTLGTNNSIWKGMGWLRIDVDMFLFVPQRLPQYSLLDSSQQPVPLHTDVFEDSHGRKVTTAPMHPPYNRLVLLFCYPLSAYLPSPLCPPLHVESPQHLHFEKDTAVDAQRFLGGVCLGR